MSDAPLPSSPLPSSPLSSPPLPWPPLIVAKKSFWIALRDLVLTSIMWIAFLFMLQGEFDLVFGKVMHQIGVRATLEHVGFGDLSSEGSRMQFLHALFPYLGLALILVVSLLSFTFDTLRRRRRALSGPPAPALPVAIEARHAELSTMAGHVGEAMEARRANLDLVTIDMRSLLTALNQLDEAALTDARSVRIVNVHLTDDGHYRIQ